MRIQSAGKHAPASSERTVSAEETLTRASRVAGAFGVTRLADITGLDRLGIPVYTAFVPKSDDTISVYNGKGAHPIDAKTGALMEAIERQTALRAVLPTVEGSLRELRRGRLAVSDPQSFNHMLRDSYAEDRSYLWTEVYDLMANEPVLVPAGLVGYGPRYGKDGSPYRVYSSNGLASGNCFEEAVCHALCELVERDAFTLAELRSQWIPRARLEAAFGQQAGAEGWDDDNAYPRIDLAAAGDPFPELLASFERAGLRPVVRDTTSDFGVCCAVASTADDSVPGFPQAHGGMGAHPNARIAVIRALTELAQSRAVDIQGAREDIMPADAAPTVSSRHTQRVGRIDSRRWLFQQSGCLRPFGEMPSFVSDDIADDIRLILSRLAGHGMERVLVADMTEPGGFAVVRVMVPGLEFWGQDRGKIGPRALQFWRQHVQ
ncbi:MAG: YcaO-like family protein [Bryobacteraceae bacterium]|jgi:ribosomal protein S12 methylthiotransferase accessory factor